MDKYIYKAPWYVNTIFLVFIAIVSSIVPFIGLSLIPLLILKTKNIQKHCVLISEYSEKELERIHSQGESIIEDANNKAISIKQSAEEKLIELNEQITNKQSIIDQIIKEATADADTRLTETKSQLSYITAEIDKKDFYISEVNRIKEELTSLDKKVLSRQEKIDHLISIQKSVNHAIKTYFKDSEFFSEQLINLPNELIVEINTLAPAITLKLHSMDYKDLHRAFRANEKIIDETLARYENRYTTKTNRAIYQLMVIGLRAELQNVLFTLTYSKLNDAIAAIKAIINKYLNIARDGSQTISSTLAKFIGELEPLFIDAVKIEYEYYVKKEEARQEQIELRAQMKEEAEERRRLKEQQEQMEKEETKYTAEIKNIRQQLEESSDNERNLQLLDKIKELESQLSTLFTKKEEIVKLQNGKAGYVYIISNLGSFGNDVFKVGMTRRLNPQERVDELGDASVPFKFDVHSFIFSKDAVQLESDLHTALESKRLNKINTRKEFFKISIDEIEILVDKFDPSAEFNKTMQAEQYYQSLSMDEAESA